MKALVIGGTKGFRKEISENLIEEGFELITVNRAKKGYKDYQCCRCDLSNLSLWERSINKILKDTKNLDLVFFVQTANLPIGINQRKRIINFFEPNNSRLHYNALF